jgi:hypothetical protein
MIAAAAESSVRSAAPNRDQFAPTRCFDVAWQRRRPAFFRQPCEAVPIVKTGCLPRPTLPFPQLDKDFADQVPRLAGQHLGVEANDVGRLIHAASIQQPRGQFLNSRLKLVRLIGDPQEGVANLRAELALQCRQD